MLKLKSEYKKISSYEAKPGEVKKVLLLYSGGLDTSVALKWIKERYKVDVVTLTLDLGQQHDDLEVIRKKALKFGAKKAIALDVKEEFANEFISKGIMANASYQGNYHLSTPIGRAILARKAVEMAFNENVEAIAHGCTGKGNDQVRIESGILTLNPKMKIIAPIREWNMDRNEEIKYAQKNQIPISASIKSPYSVDDNMWGMTWEGGEIEEPELIAPIEKFLTTYTLKENAPNKPEFIKIYFEKGVPTKLNNKKHSLSNLIIKLNKIAGSHGVGTVHLIEDRLVGVKNRGVYELPAASCIISAHKALERFVSTRGLNEVKEILDIKWAYLCYGGMWYDPVMDAINSFNDNVNKKVTGVVTFKLYKGSIDIVAIDSPYGLEHSSFNNTEGYDFNVNASPGFIDIYSLQTRLANNIDRKVKTSYILSGASMPSK